MATATTYKTSNPAFSVGGLRRLTAEDRPTDVASPDTVTIQGTALKSMILLGLLMASAGLVVFNYLPMIRAGVFPDGLMYCLIGGCLGGLVLALWTIFAPSHSPFTAPLYAIVEGLAIGAISTVFEARVPMIALQAMGITFGALFGILALYGSGIIKVTDTFRAVVIGATMAVCLVYLATIVLRLFGLEFPYIHDAGPIGIIFSLVVCVIATLNFALDFQNIVDAQQARAPRWFEWYLGFGLLLTVVWLYLEVLRLLSKLQSRN